jgi:hypothetical protein
MKQGNSKHYQQERGLARHYVKFFLFFLGQRPRFFARPRCARTDNIYGRVSFYGGSLQTDRHFFLIQIFIRYKFLRGIPDATGRKGHALSGLC